MNEEIIDIEGRNCHIFTDNRQPRALIIKPSGPFEWRCLAEECETIKGMTDMPFTMCAFDMDNLDSFRQPDNVTLNHITHAIVPMLRKRYGVIPIILGGYSLGGLFAMWASTTTDIFAAIAACSPSLWADWWDSYANVYPTQAQWVYLSVGDTEDKTRKSPFCRMGEVLRAQHQRVISQLGADQCTLEWNKGGHFDDIEQRKAKGYAWCLNKLMKEESCPL